MKDDEIRKAFENIQETLMTIVDYYFQDEYINKSAVEDIVIDLNKIHLYLNLQDKEIVELKEIIKRQKLNMQKISDGTTHIVNNRDKKIGKLEEKLKIAIETLVKINCKNNYKIEEDGKCYNSICMMNEDSELKERIAEKGCKCYIRINENGR